MACSPLQGCLTAKLCCGALKKWYGEGVFSAYELDQLDITGLLWQTGYLTIRDVRQGGAGTRYLLDFPDREAPVTLDVG